MNEGKRALLRATHYNYQEALQELEDEIVRGIEKDDNSFNGRAWCKENDIPEDMFAHAVEQAYPRLDYGVSPMVPWIGDYGDDE